MRTRLVPYVPFGAVKAPLPDALESQVVTPLGELSTANVHYHRRGVNAALLDGVIELGFEYYDDGWVEPPNCRFLSMTGRFDHLEQTPTRKYSLIGIGWMLRQAKVWEPNGLEVDADGKVQFLSASAGTIMATLIANAQGRGWGAGLSIDFDANNDSSGAEWAKIITIAYDLDIDLETILANLYQQGVCDYRWEGRTLRIFNPDAAMGRDLTTGANPIRLVVNDGQTSAPEEWTNEDLLTHAMVIGEDGARWEFTNGAVTALGRLEQVIAQGGISDEGTASLLAQVALLAGSQTRISYTREFVITEDSAVVPFRDYVPGDWVLGQRGTDFERLRTHSLSLTVNADGVKGHAVLGDRLDDLLTKLAKRTKGITGGTAAGGSGSRPSPEGPDTRTPSAPEGLVVGVDAYIDGDGAAQGRVALDWAHDGTATNGTAMTIDAFQVYYRVNELGAAWRQLSSTQDTELAHSPLPLLKADGSAEQFAFKVRAMGDNGRHSAFTPQAVVTMEPDTEPPPVPQFLAGDVTTSFRTNQINASGKGVLSDGTVVDMSRDFSHFNVYEGSSPTGPWTFEGIGVGAGMVHQTKLMPANETVWYALTAVDRSKNESEFSQAHSVTPNANYDTSELFSTLNAAQVTITNAGKLLLDSGVELGAKLAAADTSIGQAKTRLDTAETQLNVTFPARFTEIEGDVGSAVSAASAAQEAADAAQADLLAAITNGHNLIPNGDFEQGDAHWEISADRMFTQESATARSGTKVMVLTPHTFNTYPYSEYVPSEKGRTYYIEAWFRKTGSDPVNAALVGFYTQTRTTAGGNSGIMAEGRISADEYFVEGEWKKLTGTLTLASNALRTKFSPHVSVSTNTYEVDDFRVIDITESKAALDAANTAQDRADAAHTLAGTASSNADLALTSANGKNSVHRDTTPPAGNGTTVGDVWWQFTDESWTIVVGEWTWSGSTWDKQRRSHETFSSVDVGSLVVAGQSTLSDVVAQNIAGRTAQFIDLDVSRLVVTEASQLGETVAKSLWSELGRFNKVTTDMLTVGSGTNLIPDPYFLDPQINAVRVDNLDAYGSVTINDQYADKPNYIRLAVESGYTGGISFRLSPTGDVTWIPAIPGATYSIRYRTFTNDSRVGSRAAIRQLKPDGTIAYTADGFDGGFTAGYSPTSTAWGWTEREWTCPDDTIEFGLELQFNAVYDATVMGFMSPTMTPKVGNSLIVKGGVLAEHLTVTDEMWAKIINFKLIQGEQVDTNSLTSDAGFIGDLETNWHTSDVFQGKEYFGGTFTGPLFQTTSTPFEGLKFDPNGFKAWDDLTGALTVDIRPSGYAWLSGIVEASIIRGGTVEGAMITTGIGDWRGISIYVDPATGGRDPGVMAFAGSSAAGYEAAELRIGEGTNTPFQIFGPQSPLSTARASIYLDTADGVQGSIETRSRFFTAYLEKMIISGDMEITERLEVRDNLDVVGGSVTATGNGVFGGNLVAQGHSTTSFNANTHMSSSGILYRSTSSLRYKTDVQDWKPGKAALRLRSRSWLDKNPIDPTSPLKRHYGFISEEVAQILPELVVLDEYGQPDALAYDRFIAAVLDILVEHETRLDTMEDA